MVIDDRESIQLVKFIYLLLLDRRDLRDRPAARSFARVLNNLESFLTLFLALVCAFCASFRARNASFGVIVIFLYLSRFFL